MVITDPITQVYDALWTLLEAGNDFQELVKSGNRIKLTSRDRSPFKDNLGSADVPEVTILPMGATVAHQHRSTSGSSLSQGFQIRVATGEQNLHTLVFPLKWAIYKAMADWATVLTALTWKGVTYVVHCRLADAADGISEVDIARGITGWTVLWQCNVEMWFSTVTIKAEA